MCFMAYYVMKQNMNNEVKKIIDLLRLLYRQIRYRYWAHRAKNKGPLPIGNDPSTILFLLPEAGISLYINALVVIAKQLRLKGHKIYFARCFNLFERCMFMDSESMRIDATPEEKKLLCTYCFRSFDKNVIKNNFDYVDLRHFITEQDHAEVNAFINKNPNGIFDLTVDGINFTGILEYSLFLYLKKSNLENLSLNELRLWQQHLRSLLIGYKAVRKLIPALKVSHIIMCDVYSFNSVIKDMSNKIGVSLVNISFPYHKDIDLSRIKVLKNDTAIENLEALRCWPDFKNLSLPSYQIKEAVDDLIVRMSQKGTYAYSPSKSLEKDILNNLDLKKDRKTIVAYPSSPDEVEAILKSYKNRGLLLEKTEDAFSNQFEWLDELISFTENSSNFQLIIRLHPRMASNHREKWGCVAATEFQDKYAKTYQHVKIIWPEENISSFDLAEIADVVTVSWSSMGIFMARLGIPVVSGLRSALPIPNEDFQLFTPTKTEYFEAIQHLSSATPSLQKLQHAYRWYFMMYLGHCLDLKDVLGPENSAQNMLSNNAEQLENILIKNQSSLAMNLRSLQEYQGPQSLRQEQQELFRMLSRLIHFMMTNNDTNEVIPVLENLTLIERQIKYHYKGIHYVKYSPLVARITKLLKELATYQSEDSIQKNSSVLELVEG